MGHMGKAWSTQAAWLRAASVLLLVGGAWVAWYRGQIVRQEASSALVLQAAAVARAIDPAQIQTLSFTPADNDHPAFQQLREQMAAWTKAAGLRRIFSIAPRGDAFVFGPGSFDQSNPIASTAGLVCLLPERQLELFRRGESFIQDPVPGRSGAYVRAFAPVKSPRTGEMLMLVGLESQTAGWDRAVLRQQTISVAFAVALASLVLIGGRLVTNRTQRPSDKQGWLRPTELGVTACFGALLTLVAALLIQEREDTARRDLFLQLAESQTAAFKAADWDIRDTLMVGMAKYLEDDRRILPEEFHYYVHSLVRSADLQALEWIPCVPAADKAQVETESARFGDTNFVIFQRGQHGERIPASTRPMYYPVLYAEPLAGNEQVIGWDVGSEPAQRAALERAARTGLPIATDPIALTQHNDREKALAVFHPIYVRESLPETETETYADNAKRTPVGYSLALVRCSALLERVMANLAAGEDTTSVDWYQLDPGKAPIWLASWPKPRDAKAREPVPLEDVDQLRVVRPVFALAKTYALVVSPRHAFLAAHSTHGAIVAGVSGLVLTLVGTWLLAWLRTRNARLEEEVRVRTDRLQETHQELLAASRQAGMAEVATNVLHNVGNVLNSVNVSVTLLSDQVNKSKSGNLSKVSDLLCEHVSDLADYLVRDPKGRQIPSYLNTLANRLAEERSKLLVELGSLRANVEHMKNIVAMQQSYAKTGGVIEAINPAEIIEDALRLNSGLLGRYRLRVVRQYDPRLSSQVNADKHCVLQILINLIRNASFACAESNRPDKCITLSVANRAAHVQISVADNGVGIPAENLSRIFNHGFTTRKDGHGFGLHSGALGAQKMGGSLRAQSDGPGLGALFTLELPVR